VLTRRLILLGALLTIGGCSLDKQGAPDLAGPSELGLSLALSASPDLLVQDGQSYSDITVVARDAVGTPTTANLRADIFVNGSPVDFGSLSIRSFSTGNDGRATLRYTVPQAPPPTAESDTTVQIVLTPIGTNAASSLPRTVDIRVVRPGAIVPPTGGLVAAFKFSPDSPKVGDNIAFDASESKPAQGRTIVSYAWSFDNGDTGTGKLTTHAYNEPGVYVVALTVTDDLGAKASTSKTISLGNNLPTADFLMSPDGPFVGEDIVFNAKTSKAGLGRRIVSYDWDFGDAIAIAGPSATITHSYNVARKFTVVLTVEDDLGQTASVSKTVDVGDVKASLTFSLPSPIPAVNPVTVTFDATASKVAPGSTIVSYEWNFGCQSGCLAATTKTTTSPATTYDYPAVDGTYPVTVTIHDDKGHTVTSSVQTVKIDVP